MLTRRSTHTLSDQGYYHQSQPPLASPASKLRSHIRARSVERSTTYECKGFLLEAIQVKRLSLLNQ